jgi:hypothetical protein
VATLVGSCSFLRGVALGRCIHYVGISLFWNRLVSGKDWLLLRTTDVWSTLLGWFFYLNFFWVGISFVDAPSAAVDVVIFVNICAARF